MREYLVNVETRFTGGPNGHVEARGVFWNELAGVVVSGWSRGAVLSVLFAAEDAGADVSIYRDEQARGYQ